MKSLFFCILLVANTSWSQNADLIKQFIDANGPTYPNASTYYKMHNFRPLFVAEGQFTSNGQLLNEIYVQIQKHGLTPRDYGYQDWVAAQANPALRTIDLEVKLTDKVVNAIFHVANGRIDPRKISQDIKFEPKTLKAIEPLLATGDQNPLALFDSASPQSPRYKDLQKTLARLMEIKSNQSWKMIPPVALSLKKGASIPVVIEIKEKLHLLGYNFVVMDAQVDDELLAAVKDIFLNMLLKPETAIGVKSRFWIYLNADIGARIQEVELQMEKLRWIPQYLEDRHVFVNLANQTIYIDDLNLNKDGHVLEFRTVNGSVTHKTPSMKDKVASVVFNPTWSITMNILFNEELKKIRINPAAYFAHTGYRVIEMATDRVLDPMSIDWANLTRSNVTFTVVQPPGYNNALGVVKFALTNPFAIYLHDTNARGKFVNENRLLSHGCVRLQKPLDLAEYLLKGTAWTRTKIDNFVVKPNQKVDSPTWVSLAKNTMPVYLISLTVETKNDVIRFYDDYYGQNTALFQRLKKEGFLSMAL